MKTDQFAAMGLAAMLPGLQHAVEILQRQLDEYRNTLAELQQAGSNGHIAAKRGRPPQNKFDSWASLSPEQVEARKQNLSDAQRRVRGLPPKKHDTNGQARLSTGWAADPEERKREMKRRMAKWKPEAKARQKAGAAAHWKKKGGTGGAAYWAKLTPAQRSTELKRRAKVAKANREAAA